MKTMLCALTTAIAMVSCAPTTPQSRIQQNPQKFEGLSDKHKSLVESGQITRGMNPDAVQLAWGSPSGTMVGSFKGKESERWDYTGIRPIYSTGFFGTHGFGRYRGHRGYRCSGLGFGMGPEVTYLPTHIASVWFVDNQVDSWERAR